MTNYDYATNTYNTIPTRRRATSLPTLSPPRNTFGLRHSRSLDSIPQNTNSAPPSPQFSALHRTLSETRADRNRWRQEARQLAHRLSQQQQKHLSVVESMRVMCRDTHRRHQALNQKYEKVVAELEIARRENVRLRREVKQRGGIYQRNLLLKAKMQNLMGRGTDGGKAGKMNDAGRDRKVEVEKNKRKGSKKDRKKEKKRGEKSGWVEGEYHSAVEA